MIANHKGEIPFVVLIIPFLLGIGIRLNFLPAVYTIPLIILLGLLIIVFISLNLAYKKLNLYKKRWLGGALITLILFLFGCVIVARYNELNRKDHFSKIKAQYLMVRISDEPVLKNGLLRFTADVMENADSSRRSPSSGNLLITIKDSLAKGLYYGDELLIPANFNAVDPPFNPAEFNYKQYLANQNIHFQSFLYHGQYAVVSHNAGNPVIAYSLRLRQQLVEKFKSNMHDPQAIAVASTLILGYRADLSNDVLQAYSKTGTVYVLTVSGAQVAVIYFMLSFMFQFLNRYTYGKLLRAIIIISLICYYALLTGFSPAVCRAVLMVSMIVIGKTYNRYINSLNILVVSAFVLLLYDPYLITGVGFQLAYLAVGGLIVFRPIVYQWFKFKNKWADKLWSLCSVSIAAQVITFPLSAFYFHQFPVYFLVSNLFVFIPTAIIMYSGIIYLLLPQIPGVSQALGYIIERSILLMNKVLAMMEQAPFASINKLWINPAEYLLLYAIIISLFCYLYYKKWRLLQVCLVCILLLSISISLKKIESGRSYSIAFLNLHKHVGIVMKNGNSAVVISDLPDTDKNYRYSVQPYLDSSQIANVSLYNLKQDIHSAFVLKKYNLIQYLDKQILILDGKSGTPVLNEPLKTDYIYVTGNPYKAISSVDKNYSCQMLIIDAGNSDPFITEIKNTVKQLPVKYVILKRNKSLLMVSN